MQHTYQITGMTCDHCAMRVREALEGLVGVASAEVDLETGTATVRSDVALETAEVESAIEAVGYKLTA